MLERSNPLFGLVKKEKDWEIIDSDKETAHILVEGTHKFPLIHPYPILLRLYRDATDPHKKFHYMKRVHDWLWPKYIPTWHEWAERIFYAHCNDYHPIVLAGGAGIGKSLIVAQVIWIFWLSDPRKNTGIVASTTLSSAENRIWGYILKLRQEMELDVTAKLSRSKPQKITHPHEDSAIHGLFAQAVRPGDDDTVISTIIGKHPDEKLMVVLDESTDMSAAITNALPNLEKGVKWFQLWALGNSNSKNDLHGALATPLIGWDKIDPDKDYSWQTCYKNGICLYFNPYDSPAIKEKDIVRKTLLSKFLATSESIKADVIKYGDKSAAFWRFAMGFWRAEGQDDTVFTEQFLTESQIARLAEWSGFYDISLVAGLDPEMKVGGAGCVLRLAAFGQTANGRMALDFRKEEFIFRIDIQVNHEKSAERQIAEQVLEVLKKWNIPVRNLVIDATGIGRALGELIYVLSGESDPPYRIVSARVNTASGKTDPHIIVMSPSDLWLDFHKFVSQSQIRGIDSVTQKQLVSRLITKKGTKLVLEPKEDYKNRMSAIDPKLAHSPDEADAMMLATQAAKKVFGFTPGMTRPLPTEQLNTIWEEKLAVLRAQRAANADALLRPSRPELVPNFSSSIEDIPS